MTENKPAQPSLIRVTSDRRGKAITLGFSHWTTMGESSVGIGVIYDEIPTTIVVTSSLGMHLGSVKTVMEAISLLKSDTLDPLVRNAEFVGIDVDRSHFGESDASYDAFFAGVPSRSAYETLKHVKEVSKNIESITSQLSSRARAHDASKLSHAELPVFDEFTPKLAELEFGSDEYKQCLKDMKPALDNHYAENSHHPEHYPDGMSGMCLVDLVEMTCDWHASSMRHADGDPVLSVDKNTERFDIPPMLAQILKNTMMKLSAKKEA